MLIYYDNTHRNDNVKKRKQYLPSISFVKNTAGIIKYVTCGLTLLWINSKR